MNNPIGILYVDDNTAIAESIRLLVEGQPDMKWVGYLPSAERLVETVQATSPTIVLLDISMPGPHPFDVLKDLLARGSKSRAIIVSGYSDPEWLAEAIDAGAWGFVSKHESPEAIFDAVRRVAAGDVVFPRVRLATSR